MLAVRATGVRLQPDRRRQGKPRRDRRRRPRRPARLPCRRQADAAAAAAAKLCSLVGHGARRARLARAGRPGQDHGPPANHRSIAHQPSRRARRLARRVRRYAANLEPRSRDRQHHHRHRAGPRPNSPNGPAPIKIASSTLPTTRLPTASPSNRLVFCTASSNGGSLADDREAAFTKEQRANGETRKERRLTPSLRDRRRRQVCWRVSARVVSKMQRDVSGERALEERALRRASAGDQLASGRLARRPEDDRAACRPGAPDGAQRQGLDRPRAGRPRRLDQRRRRKPGFGRDAAGRISDETLRLAALPEREFDMMEAFDDARMIRPGRSVAPAHATRARRPATRCGPWPSISMRRGALSTCRSAAIKRRRPRTRRRCGVFGRP